jgi:hypothetical protein
MKAYLYTKKIVITAGNGMTRSDREDDLLCRIT